jgi:membrane protease YdiL (CAAX protease family)
MKKNNSQKSKVNATPKKNRTVFIQPTTLVFATYVLLLLSKIIDLTLINRENEYYSVVVLQMMVFLIPSAIWCKFSGEKYVKNLRLRMFGANSVLLIIAASLLMISGSLLLGFIFGGLENLSKNFSLYDTFISRDNGTVPVRLYLLLAYAVLPAICEEFVFRGILCHEYERGGVSRAIVLSSLFFALLHFNFANLPVYLFSGIVLSMTLYATRSLFGAMLAHFLYNIFGLFGQPYMSTLYNITNSTKLFMFIVGFVFLASAAIFCGEASRLYKNHLYRGHSAEYRQPINDELPKIRDSYLDVIRAPSAIACFAVYIIALIISWI